MSNETCGSCRFVLNDTCRRFPPVMLVTRLQDDRGMYSEIVTDYRPWVAKDGWCGEWRDGTPCPSCGQPAPGNGALRCQACREKARPRLLDGMSGIRDPDARCEVYDPGTPSGDCPGDGHHLCAECVQRVKEKQDGGF